MDKRHAGIATYQDDSGSHVGLYVSSGWFKFASIAGPIGVVLVGAVMWFSARPSRDEVEMKIQATKNELRSEIQQSRSEIRQDIQELRVEIRRLLRKEK